MGAYLRTFVAASVVGLLLALSPFALAAGGGGGARGGSFGSGGRGGSFGARGFKGRRGLGNNAFGNFNPWWTNGMMGGYGGMGYGDNSMYDYLMPQLPYMIPPEPFYPQSFYRRINDVLYHFDLYGNLLQATPLTTKSWPQGGQHTMANLCRTGAYWSGRLRGLPQYTIGKATITFWLDQNNCELHFQLNVADLRDITGAYVYLTDPNLPLAASPAVAPLYCGRKIPGVFCGTLAQGSLTSGDLVGWLTAHPIASLAEALDKGEILVRIQTARAPNGELEGTVGRTLLLPPAA